MSYDPILLGIQWDRLISVADEIVGSLVRTSFSTNVRESYDLSCVVFDAAGRSIAQGTYSVPSFTGTAPATLQRMLERFPPSRLEPGDVIVTNDPWLGTGHLYDINVMQPAFRNGRIVGYCMSITHLPDIGGLGFGASAREVYEEGLRLPIVKLVRRGEPDEVLLGIIEANVRVPEQTIGDVMANVAATTVGSRMLCEFMDEYGLDDMTPLADEIITFSEHAIRSRLRAARPGVYENAIDVEGPESDLRLVCRIDIHDGGVHVAFDGTAQCVSAGVNVPLCYTKAMVCYAVKCLTTPEIPNNDGSVRPVSVAAPEGCILNAVPPWPTGGRHITGHFVGPLVFGALAQALPDRVQADSGMLNLINLQGRTRDGRGVSSIFFASGGLGAMEGQDGWPTTPSPSNMTGTSVEVWEDLTDTFVVRKELLPDSGGPGERRGGLGQRIELRNDCGHPLTMSCLAGRDRFPPAGLAGGRPGALRVVMINGERVSAKGRFILEPGDRLTTLEAGGGGWGDPRRRPREAVRADIADGFVTAARAAVDYGET